MLALATAFVWQAAPAHAQDQQAADPLMFVDDAATSPAPAPPQAERPAAREVYLPEDFARYAPRNALDMIEEIPGFSVNDDRGGGGGGGNAGRGFGQASENLLINGERVSSKSTSTADQLSRIPAANVIRIEVVDGATLDIPGLAGRVANIIVRQGGPSGQFEWRPQFSTGPAGPGWFEGEVSLTGTMGSVDYTVSLENGAFIRGSEGPAIFTDALGVIDARNNYSSAEFNRPRINGSFGFDVAPGVAANLNVTAGIANFRSRERERRIAGNPFPSFLEQFRSTNDEWYYEIGGDISFPLAGGQLKLIALESFEDGDFSTRSLLDVGDLARTGSRFDRDSQSGERIGRAEYRWGMIGADWQLSGEAAFNRLDQVGRLFGYDAGQQAYVEIPFPAGAGGVREERYEALLSVGFAITENLSVQFVGGGEYSEISQTGANALSRSFQRPKGTFNLVWAPNEGLDINLEIARRVGQLDFGDFLASVNLSEDQANAGNSNLRPQQSWETRLEVAKSLGRWGSATLTLFDERIEDLVLIVPVASGGEARGNLDSARRYGLEFFGTFELEPLGWTGAQLDVRVEWEDSELLDPVTAIARRFDRNDPFQIRLDLRHDIPETDLAWGIEFRDTERAPSYRVEEVIIDHSPSTFGAVFIEHKDVLGATARIRVGNVFDANTTLLRTVYDGSRDTAPILFTEERRRKIGQVINLSISGNF